MRALPEGAVWLYTRMAATNWSGVRLCALNREGSALMTTVRMFPPKGAAETSPGMAVKDARTYTLARSANSLLFLISLLNTSSPTGKVEASKRRMKGGFEPGGKRTWARLLAAVTSAAACAILVPG